MKTQIVDTVRKLLRLSAQASNKHEANTARERAHLLMEKHNLHIEHDDDENYRERVEGVAGVFWREQLLNNIARSNSCKLLRQTSGGTYEAILAGYMSDVEKARNLYVSVSTKMIVDCCLRWKRFAGEQLDSVARGWEIDRRGLSYFDPPSPFDDGGVLGGFRESMGIQFESVKQRAQDRLDKINIVEKELVSGKAFAAWSRVYLNTASDEFGKKLVEPRVRPPVVYAEPPRVSVPRVKEETNRDSEVAKILADKKLLAEQFGAQLTERLQCEAISFGKIFGGGAAEVMRRSTPKRLTAASSWLPPPPPPTRFSGLDLDGLNVVQTVTPATVTREKIELDFDEKPKSNKKKKSGGRELDLD